MTTGVQLKPILPKKGIPAGQQVPRKFQTLANQIAKGLEKDLKAPTAAWKKKAKFTRTVRMNYPKDVLVSVSTDDDRYRFQNDGTKAHFIAPRAKKALRWKAGGKSFYSRGHRVRGIKARKWTQAVKRKWTPEVKKLGEQLMANFAKPDGLK